MLFDSVTSNPEEIPSAARLFLIHSPAEVQRGGAVGWRRIERCTPAAPVSVAQRGRLARLLGPGGLQVARSKALDLLLRPPVIFARVDAIADYVRQERPDCLLPVLAEANLAALAAAERRRCFPPVVPCLQLPLHIERWSIRRLHRQLFPLAAHAVAVSEGLAAELAALTGMPRERVSTIQNAVCHADLDARVRAAPAHPWLAGDAPTAPPVVLAAGRLERQKDFPLLIRAFGRVRARHPLRLIILGAGSERARLERLVGRLGLQDAVSLPGWTPDPLACMARAALFVLSSRWEGLPLVLLEALACGCPVVSTDCRYGPAEILAGGACGRLAPVGDAAALAAAMERTLASPPAPDVLRQRAARFSQQRMVDAWERLLGAVCASAAAGRN